MLVLHLLTYLSSIPWGKKTLQTFIIQWANQILNISTLIFVFTNNIDFLVYQWFLVTSIFHWRMNLLGYHNACLQSIYCWYIQLKIHDRKRYQKYLWQTCYQNKSSERSVNVPMNDCGLLQDEQRELFLEIFQKRQLCRYFHRSILFTIIKNFDSLCECKISSSKSDLVLVHCQF